MDDDLFVCPFPKHRDEMWDDVIQYDRDYCEWLVSADGPKLGRDMYDMIMDKLEEEYGSTS